MARKNKPKKTRNKKPSLLHYVFVGETGYEDNPDVAYRMAERYHQEGRPERFAIVDPVKPGYSFPPNVRFFQTGALQFFESRLAESIENVRDDFAFEIITLGKISNDYRAQAEFYKRVYKKLKYGVPLEKKDPNIRENESKYVRLVKRSLVPGGRFILTASIDKRAQQLVSVLSRFAFDVTQHLLSEEEVLANESAQARYDLEQGLKIYRIIATKDGKGDIKTEEEKAIEREEETLRKRRELFRRMF